MYIDPKKISECSIVLFEHDMQWRQILARELYAAGFDNVLQTNTATEALQAIRDSDADAIVLPHDLRLINFLRNHSASPNRRIVIILVTGKLATEDILAERDSGVHEIVAKPASVEQVITHLYNSLTHPRRFVESKSYHGPDRRRHVRAYDKPERRRGGQVTISDASHNTDTDTESS